MLLPLFASFLAVAIPSGVVIAVFSTIGAGFSVYNAFGESWMEIAGGGAALFTAAWLSLLFILDFSTLHPFLQVILGAVLVAGAIAAALFRVMAYPWAVMILCFLVSLLLLAFARINICAKSSARTFLTASGISFTCCSIFSLVVWIVWTAMEARWWTEDTRAWLADQSSAYAYFSRDIDYTLNYTTYCGAQQSTFTGNMTLDDSDEVQAKCRNANVVWFVQYWGPVGISIANLTAAAFALGLSRSVKGDDAPEPIGGLRRTWREAVHQGQTYFWNVNTKQVTWERPVVTAETGAGKSQISSSDVQALKTLTKRCSVLIAAAVALLYGSQYVAGASVSLGGLFAACATISLIAVIGYLFTEVDYAVLKELTSEDSLGSSAVGILKSDWVRAIGVGAFNILIPFVIALDVLRMRLRRCRGKVDGTNTDRFTPQFRAVVDEINTWYLVGVFQKVNLLAKIGVLLLVFTKLTYVFFSWLNEAIGKAGWQFWQVSLMCAGIDLAMFLNPLVPGTAVYLFNGVVLGSQSQVNGSVGFWPGYAISSSISLLCKLLATTGQYGLGLFAGKFVKVQQFVGVDKVSTRAMEKLLKARGLGLGKVGILVAGPDFPTSMLCGILQVNIPQMILGTLPVVPVTIAPQVLVGSLLVKADGSSDTWSAISAGVTGAALVFQLAATLIFSLQILKIVEQDGEELAKPRDEHEAVAELTKKEAAYNGAFRDVTGWDTMSAAQKALLSLSVSLYLLVGFILAADYASPAYDKFCFRSFAITSKITDPFVLRGLDGNATQIVIMPTGWVVLGLAVLAETLDFAFGKWMACVTRRKMDEVTTVVTKVQMIVPQHVSSDTLAADAKQGGAKDP